MNTTLIPVELCEYVLKNKLTKPFQVYILLKWACSGKMKISDEDFDALAELLGRRCRKTVKNNMKKLLKLNWVGFNRKSKYNHVRGIPFIQKQLKLTARSAAEFDFRWIDQLQEFMVAAVAGFIANQQQKSRWILGQQKARPNQGIHPSSNYNRVSTTLLASKLKVSLSTAHLMKKNAMKADFIDVIPHYEDLNIDVVLKDRFKKVVPEDEKRIRIKDGKLVIQLPDEIIPKIRFKKRKKIETVIKHI